MGNSAGGGALSISKEGSGTWVLSGNNTYSGATTVTQGALVINGAVASTSVVVDGSLQGSGVAASATFSGTGSIDPGNSPGILTGAAADPTAGLDFNFEFGTANALPTWSNASASGSDVLRLTNGSAPFTAALDGTNTVTIYFNVGSLNLSDVFSGGFYTDKNADFLGSISSGAFQYFLADVGGNTTYMGGNYTQYTGPYTINVSTFQVANADFAGGNVTGGYVSQFTVVPEPRAALLGGLGLLALLRRRRN
jgi:autotransporter-associated beta strand protein